jgi:hypothetical protein
MSIKHIVAGMIAVSALAAGLSQPAATPLNAQTPAAQTAAPEGLTVWYFYRVKWGFQEEFVTLFNKNHLPVLRERVKTGRIGSVRTYVPIFHGDGRADWTFAVVITFRDPSAVAGGPEERGIVKRLYPDQDTFRREEQRRFELLDAHWEVPLNDITPPE